MKRRLAIHQQHVTVPDVTQHLTTDTHTDTALLLVREQLIGLCSVLRPLQHSIGYIGDGFYRSKDPTNSIKILKENLQNTNQTTETTQNTHIDIQ